MSAIVDIEELGRRIRKLRLDRRMTLKQVEQASGLSATHLSEIERGRTSPTIGALVRIARALEKDASYFIEIEERPDIAHLSREALRPVAVAPGVTSEALSHGVPGSRIFPYRLVFATGCGGLRLPAQELPADAIYLVRKGIVEASFGAERWTLAPGDAAQASFATTHALRPLDGAEAEVIAVLSTALEELRSELPAAST